MNTSVAVIVPTFKRPTYLSRAIDSVLRQNTGGCEIVVVDDNGKGTDSQLETAKLMGAYAAQANVHYVVHDRNQGGSAARNSGVRHIESDYVAFLDDDDEWLPEFVKQHLEVFERTDADLVYCNCERRYEGSKVRDSRLPVNHRGFVFERLLEGWCPTSTSLFMIKRSSLAGVEPFDEQFPSYQDYDCWLGLAQTCRFDYTDEVLMIKHSHGTEQISRNPVTRRNGLNILKKKWLNRLNPQQLPVFQSTLENFEQELLRQEFLLTRRSEGVLVSLPKAMKYISYTNFKLRHVALVIRNLIFPYR